MIKCAECGIEFEANRAWQSFCCSAHRKAHHNRWMIRGETLGPLMYAARLGGRYAGASKVTAHYAHKEACALVDRWIVEDRAAGRSPEVTVEARRLDGWRAADVGF